MTRPYQRHQATPKQRQAECDAFNAAHPIGSSIRVFPGDLRGRIDTVQVAEPGAYVMGGGVTVVQVTGGTRADGTPASYGCIAITHVHGPA